MNALMSSRDCVPVDVSGAGVQVAGHSHEGQPNIGSTRGASFGA